MLIMLKVKVDGVSPPSSSDFPVIAVTLPCVLIVLIILVIVLVVYLRRSKPQKNKKYRVSKQKEERTDVTKQEETSEEKRKDDPGDTAPESRFVDEPLDDMGKGKGTENPLFNELNNSGNGKVDLDSD